MPSYSRYKKRKHLGAMCIVLDDLLRYSKYVRAGARCDVLSPSLGDQDRLNIEEERLNKEEAKTTAILIEAVAKLARL